jgi:hypothetical protein
VTDKVAQPRGTLATVMTMGTDAILAPVPAVLLNDALDNGFRRVAFGSMAWEFFRRLSNEVATDDLPVLLYASHEEEVALEATWGGRFAGWHDASEIGREIP